MLEMVYIKCSVSIVCYYDEWFVELILCLLGEKLCV